MKAKVKYAQKVMEWGSELYARKIITSDTCTKYVDFLYDNEGTTSNYKRCRDTDIDWYWRWECGTPKVVRKSPQEQLREILQKRQAPHVITSRKGLAQTDDLREQRARETLRRVLGDDKFKRFLKHGFVSVRAKSGLVYQIFPAHGITNVYRDGEKIERLCVVLRGDFPPTDSLIMRYLLILNDERDFRKHAIKHTVYPNKVETRIVSEPESLNEIWSGLKRVA